MIAEISTATGSPLLTLAGGVWGLLGIAVAVVAKAYLVPYLQVEKRRKYAEWIAHIADEITDELSAKYPQNKWMEFLDESVDSLMNICGISKETAARAINAASGRKTAVEAEL